jgi:SAM-dependent methyltransferase
LMKGEVDMLELLTQDDVLTDFYAAISYDCGRYVAAVAHKEPLLRILEVGAGTGGTSALVLEELFGCSPRGHQPYASYTFTDISAGFFAQAKERFKDRPGVRYEVLDISQDPLTQGFELESFDLIIAANVVHATPSLNITLLHLHCLLRAGGRLVISELETTSQVPGYVFGWFAGWWLGEDDDRRDEPFVTLSRWSAELSNAGFELERSVTDRERPEQYTTLMVARKEMIVSASVKPVDAVTVLCESPHGDFTDHMIRQFESQGVQISIVGLGDDLGGVNNVISTVDMECPLFGSINQSTLERFQMTMNSLRSAKMLWIMPPAQRCCVDPNAAASLGVLRTARLELDAHIATLEIAKSEHVSHETIFHVWAQISRNSNKHQQVPDYEYVVQQGAVQVGRHRPFVLTDELSRKRSMNAPRSKMVALEIEEPGILQSVGWEERPAWEKPLADDEVEIETRAVGINFHVTSPSTSRMHSFADENRIWLWRWVSFRMMLAMYISASNFQEW